MGGHFQTLSFQCSPSKLQIIIESSEDMRHGAKSSGSQTAPTRGHFASKRVSRLLRGRCAAVVIHFVATFARMKRSMAAPARSRLPAARVPHRFHGSGRGDRKLICTGSDSFSLNYNVQTNDMTLLGTQLFLMIWSGCYLPTPPPSHASTNALHEPQLPPRPAAGAAAPSGQP